jgi:hypothetical protein
MTSQAHTAKFIPKQFVTRPDFQRGTMGADVVSSNFKSVDAAVIDRKQRDAIANYS